MTSYPVLKSLCAHTGETPFEYRRLLIFKDYLYVQIHQKQTLIILNFPEQLKEMTLEINWHSKRFQNSILSLSPQIDKYYKIQTIHGLTAH